MKILKKEKEMFYTENILTALNKLTFLVGINFCPDNFDIYFTDCIIIPSENIMFFHIHISGGWFIA